MIILINAQWKEIIMNILKWLLAMAYYFIPSKYRGGPLDIVVFNEKFVAANREMAKKNTDGLRMAIALLIESLQVSGDYAQHLRPAIEHLNSALFYHNRATVKGPWNRDHSGYGVVSWYADQHDRNDALVNAWPYIEKINDDLKSQGLGWSC